jgi:hypothetical protein
MRRCSWRSDRDPNGPRWLAGSVERSPGREMERDPLAAGHFYGVGGADGKLVSEASFAIELPKASRRLGSS